MPRFIMRRFKVLSLPLCHNTPQQHQILFSTNYYCNMGFQNKIITTGPWSCENINNF